MAEQRFGGIGGDQDMRVLILLLLSMMLCSTVEAQSWSNVIASSRAIDWTGAGLPGSITYGSGGSACNGSSVNCVETTINAWTPPTRTKCGSTLTPSGGDDTSQITTAFAACPGVRLGPGVTIQ